MRSAPLPESPPHATPVIPYWTTNPTKRKAYTRNRATVVTVALSYRINNPSRYPPWAVIGELITRLEEDHWAEVKHPRRQDRHGRHGRQDRQDRHGLHVVQGSERESLLVLTH